MFRNLLNYLRWQSSDSLPVILRGMLDQFRDRRISDFTRQHETIVWEMPPVWRELKPGELKPLLQGFSPADQLLILELASFHRSGYVRQKAVELLSRRQDGNELRCLLIRQNDWVDNVASAASAAVVNRVTDKYREALVNELPFVLHLNETGRRNNRPVLQRILELLVSREIPELLLTIRQSHSADVLRSFFKVCMQLQIDGIANLVRAGLVVSDSYIRGSCMQFVAQKFPPAERLEIAVKQNADDSVAVRRIVLMINVESGGPAALEALQRALFDPSAAVRDIAQFYLRREQRDVAEYYRQELQRQPESLIALQGLSETGGSSDEQCFMANVQHRYPRRRLAALRGLSHSKGERVDRAVLEKLLDSSPRIVRVAERIIQEQGRLIQGQQLLELYLATTNVVSRHAILNLFDQLGKWQAVLWLLRLLTASPVQDHQEIQGVIAAWFLPPRENRVFVKPFAQELEELNQTLSRLQVHLTPFIQQELFKVLHQ